MIKPDGNGNGEADEGVAIPVTVGATPEKAAATAAAAASGSEAPDTTEADSTVDQAAEYEAEEDGAGNGVDGDEANEPVDLVARLREELAKARADLTATHERLLRKAAELKNTQRRHDDQMAKVKKYGIEEAVKEMLPVLDDLDLALEHVTKPAEGAEPPTLENFVEGVKLVKKKFSSALERHGIVAFDSVGEPFDPTVHEAISQQTTDEVPDGHVVAEFLKGYTIHDRLLRPALVIVAKAP